MSRFNCPKCGTRCARDEVDVGVGILNGPWGCGSCGWSEYPEYDCSEGESPAQQASPDRIVDQYGGSRPKPILHGLTFKKVGAS